MVFLTKYELVLCFLIYFSFLIYGCCNLISVRNDILKTAKHDFPQGWEIIDKPYDDSAIEFECFKAFIYRNFIWYLLHLLASEVMKCFNSKLVPAMHFLIGVSFVIDTYKIHFQLMIFIQFISFYALRNIQSKFLGWTLASLWIILINQIKKNVSYFENFNEYFETYQFVILLSWNILRGLSFIFDRHKELEMNPNAKKWSILDFIKYSGYVFYFPTYIFGPLIIYKRYSQLFSDDFHEKDILERVKRFIFDLLRVGFWILFFNVSLHYFYIYYLEYDHKAVKLLNFLGLYGFGYLMGLYFNICYIISYGVGIAFLRYEGIDPPRQPICIARVHFYSMMWRYFDEGLYEFLFKYIYSELQTKSSSGLRKLFASFVTFIFIFVWHGLTVFICIWSILNFLCITIEKLFKLFWKSKFCNENIKSRFSINNQKRIFGLIGCHIYIPSVISNFYFFAGTETGNYFLQTTYSSGFGHYLILATVCYCIFQASEWIYQINENNINKKNNYSKTVN